MFRKAITEFFWLAGLAILMYFNIARWHSIWLGVALLIWYLVLMGMCYRRVLVKFFNFLDKNTTAFVGAFLGLFVFSALAGMAIIFYRLDAVMIAVIIFVSSIIGFGLREWAIVAKRAHTDVSDPDDQLAKEQIPNVHLGAIAFLVLIMFGLYYLSESVTGHSIGTPWQTIHPCYIYIFGAATLVIGVLVFSQLRARSILILLIIYTFLLHAYLPLTHELFYGADQWRHLAAETRIAQGLSPGLVSESPSDAPFFLSSAPGTLFYSQFWGLSVTLAQILQVSLITIAKWLLPILWSLIFPLLAYNIGLRIFAHKKLVLFLIWLTALPFAIQSSGSLTLPSNLGFLFWLLAVTLIVARLQERRYEQIIVLGLFGIFSIFGYGLYLLLFLGVWALAEIISARFFEKRKKYLGWVLGIAAVLTLPAVELVVKYSEWGTRWGVLGGIKQFLGNFTAWYLATGPRPHIIDTGNVLFNQVPVAAFVLNFFTQNLWWLVPVAIVILLAALFGLVVALRSREIKIQFFGYLSLTVFGGYFICRYLLSGANILSRRSDVVIAFLILILAMLAAQTLWLKYFSTADWWGRRVVLFLIMIILSVGITASYSLGPNLLVVSSDAFEAMQYINGEIAAMSSQPCVLADTYPLLTLEYLSVKKISGGGFPFGANFSQTERVDLFEKMRFEPATEIFTAAREVTHVDTCYFVASSKEIKYNSYTYGASDSWKMFGDYLVWKNVK